MDASFSTGPLIIAAIYGAFYINGHVTDEQNQDLGGFFTLYAIIFAAISLIGVFTIGIYTTNFFSDEKESTRVPEDLSALAEEEDPNMNAVGRADDTEPLLDTNETGQKQEMNITGLALVRDLTFHLVAWPLILSSAVQLMVFNNIGIYLKAFNHESHTTAMAMTNFASTTVGKFCVGTLSDYFLHKFPRATFILITNTMQAISLFVCIFWADNLIFLYATILFVSFSNGSFWCLTPTITSEYFGTKYIGRNWGLMLFCTGIPAWVLQVVYGELYSAAIDTPGVTYCYGLQCFAWSFVMGFGLSIVSVLLTSILLYEVYIGHLPKYNR